MNMRDGQFQHGIRNNVVGLGCSRCRAWAACIVITRTRRTDAINSTIRNGSVNNDSNRIAGFDGVQDFEKAATAPRAICTAITTYKIISTKWVWLLGHG
jgi:hypothetical protein